MVQYSITNENTTYFIHHLKYVIRMNVYTHIRKYLPTRKSILKKAQLQTYKKTEQFRKTSPVILLSCRHFIGIPVLISSGDPLPCLLFPTYPMTRFVDRQDISKGITKSVDRFGIEIYYYNYEYKQVLTAFVETCKKWVQGGIRNREVKPT